MCIRDRTKRGSFVNSTALRVGAYTVAAVIAVLNVWLLFQTVREWIT